MFLTLLMTAHADEHLYAGLSLPILGGGWSAESGAVAVFDLAPATLEWRATRRLGLRLATDVKMTTTEEGLRLTGAEIRLEAPWYFGPRAKEEGMLGFFVGPTGGVGFTQQGEVGIAGITAGYSGRLAPDLRWRTGAWVGATIGETVTPAYGVTFAEVGGFVF